jgi:hypothetical protein
VIEAVADTHSSDGQVEPSMTDTPQSSSSPSQPKAEEKSDVTPKTATQKQHHQQQDEETPDHLTKEWTDMADGISLYFEQALMHRLLYPSEMSQILVLEKSLEEGGDNNPLQKVDIYGCEHLLRLITVMPRMLDQRYQDAKNTKMERKKGNGDDDDDEGKEQRQADEEGDHCAAIDSMILAKLQDLSRFLQKNQSTLFCLRYRKKNELEMKLERKIQKRQERRLKNKATRLLQEVGAKDEIMVDS